MISNRSFNTGVAATIMERISHETWQVESPLDAVELAIRLNSRLEYTWKWSTLWLHPTQPFLHGYANFRGFNAYYGYSGFGFYAMRPLVEILGRFFSNDRGTAIHVHMRPSLFIVLFFATWMGTVTLFCMVGAVTGFRDGEWVFLILSGLMGAVGIIIPWIMLVRYRRMAPLAKEHLAQLLAKVHDDAARNVPLQPMINVESPSFWQRWHSQPDDDRDHDGQEGQIEG